MQAVLLKKKSLFGDFLRGDGERVWHTEDWRPMDHSLHRYPAYTLRCRINRLWHRTIRRPGFRPYHSQLTRDDFRKIFQTYLAMVRARRKLSCQQGQTIRSMIAISGHPKLWNNTDVLRAIATFLAPNHFSVNHSLSTESGCG